MKVNLRKRKNNLIESLKKQGFEEHIIEAFKKVERERFVPRDCRSDSYEDIPLPIGQGQTISQPSTIAFMLSLLNVQDGEKILEVGSGSGYVLSLLSKINPNGEIFGTERILKLVESSKENLKEDKNIKIFYTPNTLGLEKHSPFDRILVSASAQNIPEELVEQLKEGGVLVIPVLNSIMKLVKKKEYNEIEEYEGFAFVPLVKD